ncbi:MAG: hypothetical protein ACD_54C00823G0001, partial [uncultured bacterium]
MRAHMVFSVFILVKNTPAGASRINNR